jgi:regulation of enolase protein 1 (concanavalin A-like superfamily)
VLSAPALLGEPPDADFTLHAHVRIDGAARFDAGVLFVHGDERTWAKLCLERSPGGAPMIVSVVTRGVSDDCNSETIEADEAWLRIARRDGAFAFHWSVDGRRWSFVRFFALPATSVRVGFEAQSPIGTGCTATFDAISYSPSRLGDLRDGS